MTNNEIVTSYYPLLTTIINNIVDDRQLVGDITNDLILILLEMDNEALNDIMLRGHLPFYFSRICLNNWRSSTSPVYYKYRKRFSDKQISNIKQIYYDERI